MLKMTKKYSIVAVALIALLCAGTAYALITIWSPVVHVDLRYSVVIDMTYTKYVPGIGMELYALVRDAGGSPVNGIVVAFYTCDVSGNSPVLIGYGDASGTTAGSGYSYFLWTGASAVDYYFEAYCAI